MGKVSAFVLQGKVSGDWDWWTIKALRTVGELLEATARYRDNPERRIVWLDDCPWYK